MPPYSSSNPVRPTCLALSPWLTQSSHVGLDLIQTTTISWPRPDTVEAIVGGCTLDWRFVFWPFPNPWPCRLRVTLAFDQVLYITLSCSVSISFYFSIYLLSRSLCSCWRSERRIVCHCHGKHEFDRKRVLPDGSIHTACERTVWICTVGADANTSVRLNVRVFLGSRRSYIVSFRHGLCYIQRQCWGKTSWIRGPL